MLKRFLILTMSALIIVPGFVNTAYATTENLEEATIINPLVISEIYPDSIGDDRNDISGEFIELHNTTDSELNLESMNLFLTIIPIDSVTEYTIDLSGLLLGPQEYLALRDMTDDSFTFSLSNSGATVALQQTIGTVSFALQQFSYAAAEDSFSWSLIEGQWAEGIPTPGAENVLKTPEEEPIIVPDPDEDQNTPEEDIVDGPAPENSLVCTPSTIFINEIVANPAGSDADGGEFIELYNAGTQTVTLTGCSLATDKKSGLVLDGMVIPSGGYYAYEVVNNLLNNGGTVSFVTTSDEFNVEYPALGDDESWSNIDGEWQVSSVMTPGAVNQPSPAVNEAETATTSTNELTPCPEGKFRNPETNRCKNIVETAGTLLPCSAGSIRNPETNRCRKITALSAASSSLKPCEPGQERNPDTNRCRKIANATNEPKPCQEGYERNLETNRCRKSAAVLSSASLPDDTQSERGIHPSLLILMTVLAVGYGLYEYRLDIANLTEKLKKERRFSFKRQIS